MQCKHFVYIFANPSCIKGGCLSKGNTPEVLEAHTPKIQKKVCKDAWKCVRSVSALCSVEQKINLAILLKQSRFHT